MDHQTLQQFIVATSHFPIGGVNARTKSSELAMTRICEIAGNNPFIFGGSLMLYTDLDGESAYRTLIKYANDYRNPDNHIGHQTSYIGLPFETKHAVHIDGNGIAEPRNLDMIVHRGFDSKLSYIISGEIDTVAKKLAMPLVAPIRDAIGKHFPSNRFMIGTEISFSEKAISINRFDTVNPKFHNFETNTLNSMTRVVNWNIKSGFLDDKNAELLTWSNRKGYVFEMLKRLTPDLILLQEMCLSQAREVNVHLINTGYNPYFRTVHTGLDLTDVDDDDWIGSITCIAFRKNRFKLINKGGFWLKDDFYVAPPYTPDTIDNRKNISDGGTNKCFGDSHSYRHCQCLKIYDQKMLCDISIFQCDFPHSGNSNSKIESAKLCQKIINEMSTSSKIIFAGEFCTFEEDIELYKILSNGLTDWRTTINGNYGHQATFIGYPTDKYLVDINEKGVLSTRNIDSIFHFGFEYGCRSFSLAAEFDPTNKSLIFPLVKPIINRIDRLFSSDHCLIGVDLV